MLFFKKKGRSNVFVIQQDGYFGSVQDGIENIFDTEAESVMKKDHALATSIPARRLKFGLIIFLAVMILFVGRAGYLQVIKGDHFASLAEGNRYRSVRIVPPRGDIYDRNGLLLAENIPSFILTMTIADLPDEKPEQQVVFNKVINIAGIQQADIDLLLTDYSKTPFDPVPVVRNIQYESAIRLAIELADLPGFDLQTTTQRYYPAASTSLSHVLGYTGKINVDEYKDLRSEGYRPIDMVGKIGVEKSKEHLLRGKPGKITYEVNAIGSQSSVVSKDDAIDGSDITLGIDLEFQKFIESRLQSTLKAVGAKRGSVVALDPQTGSVRALVSLPSFDNNVFAQGISQEEYTKLIEDKNNPLFFRAISGEFPSGSTFKPFVLFAALSERIVSEYTSFVSSGGLRINQWYFPDWKAGGHGVTDARKAIAESVNTYFYIIGGGFDKITGLGVGRITDYARRFGFGTQTGLDLPNEADGFLPSKEWKIEAKGERWYVGDTYHLAIGQGDFLTTPIQMAAATSVIANKGTFIEPHVVETIGKPQSSNISAVNKNKIKELDDYSLKVVREGMRKTVTTGSARSMASLPKQVAGKTGTAQTPGNKPYHSWFNGFGPYTDPTISLVVLVEEGGESNYAAVPLAREIFYWWFTQGGG
jgi:penicillin-binding protein 2